MNEIRFKIPIETDKSIFQLIGMDKEYINRLEMKEFIKLNTQMKEDRRCPCRNDEKGNFMMN